MQISVTFRHLETSDPLSDYATEKVDRIVGKYLKNAVEAHVILSVDGHVRRNRAEIIIHASNFDIAAHSDSDDMYSAIDFALAKVEAQVRKHKDRINDRKGRATAAEAATIIPVDVLNAHDDEGGVPRVIETDTMPAKPLSVEDAVMQLDLQHADFLVFRNSSTNTISVVYRRRDGNYGLIVPNN